MSKAIAEQETSLTNQVPLDSVPEEHLRRVNKFLDRLVAAGINRDQIEVRYYLIDTQIWKNADAYKAWDEELREWYKTVPENTTKEEHAAWLKTQPKRPEPEYTTATILKARARFRLIEPLAEEWNKASKHGAPFGDRDYTYYYVSTTAKWNISDNMNYYPPRVNKQGAYFPCRHLKEENEPITEGPLVVPGTELNLQHNYECRAKYYLFQAHEHYWQEGRYSRYERISYVDGNKHVKTWQLGQEEPEGNGYRWYNDDGEENEDIEEDEFA